MEAICDNALTAGQHRIEMVVGDCSMNVPWRMQPVNVITGGLDSPSRLHVDEVRLETDVTSCKGLSM